TYAGKTRPSPGAHHHCSSVSALLGDVCAISAVAVQEDKSRKSLIDRFIVYCVVVTVSRAASRPPPGCVVRSSRGYGIEELEDRGQHHRHHAAMIAVDLEILEIEVAVPHELCERAAAFERRRRARALGHQDRKISDHIEWISLGIDERPGHRRDGAPTLRIPGREMPC